MNRTVRYTVQDTVPICVKYWCNCTHTRNQICACPMTNRQTPTHKSLRRLRVHVRPHTCALLHRAEGTPTVPSTHEHVHGHNHREIRARFLLHHTIDRRRSARNASMATRRRVRSGNGMRVLVLRSMVVPIVSAASLRWRRSSAKKRCSALSVCTAWLWPTWRQY